MPKLGDMIVETCPNTSKVYIGLVSEIKLDKWGHQSNVMIEWSDSFPKYYFLQRGYSGVTIHNIRSRFEVIRGGVKIQ